MRLFPWQRRLEIIDGTLRAEAPALAAKYDMFARLARDEGEPPSEKGFRPRRAWRRQVYGWWWRRTRRLRAAVSGPRAGVNYG